MNLLILFSRCVCVSVCRGRLMYWSRNLNEAPPAFVLLHTHTHTHTHVRFCMLMRLYCCLLSGFLSLSKTSLSLPGRTRWPGEQHTYYYHYYYYYSC